MRLTTYSALGVFLLEGALQVSGYQNLPLAIVLGLLGVALLIPQVLDFVRRKKSRMAVLSPSLSLPIEISYDPQDATCFHTYSTSQGHHIVLHTQFRVKVTNRLNMTLRNVSVRVMSQSGIEYLSNVSLPKNLRQKDRAASTVLNPFDHDYFDLLRWEYDHGVKLLLCLSDGEVEIPHALRTEFQVVVRASAAGADRYHEKRYAFVQPTDGTGEDWLIGRVIMREAPL